MSVDQIELWHKRARPEPTEADFNVQLGCHFEEIVEMLDALDFTNEEGIEYEVRATRVAINALARMLKSGELRAFMADRKEFLDSLADQVVTAIGAGYCAGMKTADAVAAVNRSNYSKFDKNGYPIFNENGKIAKGPDYAPPDLEGMY
jgi:predicted HAD superfamily Cof-like phosphohydrolase